MKIEFDSMVEAVARGAARRFSRRNVLSVMGKAMVGGLALPLLPIDRMARASEGMSGGWDNAKAQTSDPSRCDYWAYCAQGGYLCGGCGGSPSTCPPGTDPSPSAWIGTCYNPDDGKQYLIAYRDCCGNKGSCQQFPCEGRKGEKPPYVPQLNDDTIWCFGSKSMMYHCSGAVIIGEA